MAGQFAVRAPYEVRSFGATFWQSCGCPYSEIGCREKDENQNTNNNKRNCCVLRGGVHSHWSWLSCLVQSQSLALVLMM